jgi:hypothetical protein
MLRTRVLVLGFALTATSCTHSARPASTGVEPAATDGESSLREARLVTGSDRPVLFAGTESDAPVFGFIASDTEVLVTGPAQNGRVPVRIDGALRVKAFVPEELLAMRVQRRGRVRGTPTYVGPNDVLHVLGPASEPGRLRVRVAPRVGNKRIGPFEGTYPIEGLAAQKAPTAAEQPAPGTAHVLPPGRALSLFDAPGGSAAVEIPPQAAPLSVMVIADEQGWRAVRIGDGPYVIGYTQDPLTQEIEPPAPAAPVERAPGAMPKQLQNEGGAAKRVAPETRVLFNEQVVAVFKAEGWARVLAEYPEGQVDVFAAADDGVAVRGLVPASALSEPSAAMSQEPPRLAPVQDVFEEPAVDPAPPQVGGIPAPRN